MKPFFFDGRSRENRMRLAHDHRPTREQVLQEAQKRRQARMEVQKYNQCALKIQCRVRMWQARQLLVRFAVEDILMLEKIPATGVVTERNSSPDKYVHKSTDTGPRLRDLLQRLGRACWCLSYIRQHRAIMSLTLAELLSRKVDSGTEDVAGQAAADSGSAPLLLTSRSSLVRAQISVEHRCSGIISKAIRNLLRESMATRFALISQVPLSLLSYMVSTLFDGLVDEARKAGVASDSQANDEGSLSMLRELSMVVAGEATLEAMECFLSSSLRSCVGRLVDYPDTRQALVELLFASLRLCKRRWVGGLRLVSPAWAEACWACLTVQGREDYFPLTTNPLVVLLSTESEGTCKQERRDGEANTLEDWIICGDLLRGVASVAHARLQTFSLSGLFPHSNTTAVKEATATLAGKESWRVIALTLLGRLTRLLPYFLQSNEGYAQHESTALSSTWYMPTQKIWLWCISILSERLCQTDLFVQALLFDFHHSRVGGIREQISSLDGRDTGEPSEARQERQRNLVSYLFSSTGGLRLLEQLAACPEQSQGGSSSMEGPVGQAHSEVHRDATDLTALEITCRVYAWPLYAFSLASPGRRLETAAVFAKLLSSPRLIQQLWQLYKSHSAGLLHVLENRDLLHKLCREATPAKKDLPVLFWPVPPKRLLTSRNLSHAPANAFWDPNAAISVFFLTVFSYYVDVTNFSEELSQGTVVSREDCLALILALKEIVYRSHFYGVVPSTNSEAVAHLAYSLFVKLHIIDEATAFVTDASLWICTPKEGDTARLLARVPLEMWDNIATEHDTLRKLVEEKMDNYARSALSPESINEEDDSIDEWAPSTLISRDSRKPDTASNRPRLPGDDLIFQASCEWSQEQRVVHALLHAPFMFPFHDRASLLTALLLTRQLDQFPVFGSSFRVRRGNVFGDAFHYFSACPESAQMYMVRFTEDGVTLEEGYGRGVYREFLVLLCKEGFATEHGLFQQTDSGMVYPSPFSYEATGDSNHLQKIAFLGAMVGRSLCDGILQDVPFALHFRNSLLGRRNSINNLKSFDEQLYRQLKSLTQLTAEEVEAMGLTFVYTVNALGITREVELISGGADITVTTSNCLHYMHLVSDFKLNREGAEQTRAFEAGLKTFLKPVWLQLFDSNELLKLFSGDQSGKIDIADWKAHTVYTKPEDAESVSVKFFWQVVESLSTEQQRLLLRFATSVNRPPLLGFRFLSPPFNIQLLESSVEDRLPSAATCFSTLKLPPYTNYTTARQKIIAAIEGAATFDLT